MSRMPWSPTPRKPSSLRLSSDAGIDFRWLEHVVLPVSGITGLNPFNLSAYGPNKGSGILLPDRDVINPDVEVVDQSGNVFSLVYAGSRRTFLPVYNLPSPNKWPRDREYATVRIRSSILLSAKPSIGIPSQQRM
jgi:hypothetical protein